ncbi:MAG: DNA topoisomerase IB [Deltaproteobacteria bacterium]|nr:DNA topoisomerase IB [Deltaproteobacteria bacterium]
MEARPDAGTIADELGGVAASARAAGLHYVADDRPGIRRVRSGKGFRYLGPDGRPVRDEETLRRIRALAIPPAYTDVWITTDPRGHVQATARDAKLRKQYRYHPRWREVRDAVKYEHMVAFAHTLPRIRARCAEDLARPGMCRERVLALVVTLLEQTRIRVGNEEYARKNHSFGLTTLETRHVAVHGQAVRLSFRGKSGKHHSVTVRDRRVARVVRRCMDIPGQELFTYVDDTGVGHAITSGDVNDYLRALAGRDVTAKDFRTWGGTVLAAEALRSCPACPNKTKGKRQIVRVIEDVSRRLGNTPSVCRKSYVHPAVLEAYLAGTISHVRADRRESGAHGLDEAERFTLALLQAQARAASAQPSLTEKLETSLRAVAAAAAAARRHRRAA